MTHAQEGGGGGGNTKSWNKGRPIWFLGGGGVRVLTLDFFLVWGGVLLLFWEVNYMYIL